MISSKSKSTNGTLSSIKSKKNELYKKSSSLSDNKLKGSAFT